MSLRARNLLWLAVLACPSPGTATPAAGTAPSVQGGSEADVNERITRSLAVFRDEDASGDDRARAAREISELGWRGPWRLFTETERLAKGVRRDSASRLRALERRFPKRARAIVQRRMTGRARAEIDRLRETVLETARDPELSKDRIRSTSDPALARLRELQTVSVAQVWESDEKLHGVYQELLDDIALHRELTRYQELARDRLLAHPDTPSSRKRLDDIEPGEDRDRVDAMLRQQAADATPMSATDRERIETNRTRGTEIGAEELAGIAYLNRIRILLGLPVQLIDVKLCAAARGHSEDMVEHGFFAHESPLEGKKTPWMRASAAGTSASAENITRGAATGREAIMRWWYSPGHHRNMLGGQGRVGLGRHQQTWTQLFG